MKPAAFDYHRPDTVAEAVQVLAEFGDEAKVLAGGQSLIPMLNLRLAFFDNLVDIGRIPELRGIERRDGEVWVGAATTEAAVGADGAVAEGVPLLALTTPYVGHLAIRSRGTLGGVIAHADPAAEYCAVARALDATMEVAGPGGTREVAAADFFQGIWSTDLASAEVLTGVRFPVWGSRSGFAVEEFARRHGDFAIAGAVVGLEADAADVVTRCAIGLIGMGAVPERAHAAEAAAVGSTLSELDPVALGQAAVADLSAIPVDQNGDQRYRRRVGAAMVQRALVRVVAEVSA